MIPRAGLPSSAWSRASLRRYWQAMLVVGLGLVFSLAVFYFARHWEQKRMEEEMHRRMETKLQSVQKSLGTYFECLLTLRSHFQINPGLDRTSFNTLAAGLRARHPGIKALEWVPRVPGPWRARYEAQARREGFAGFQFKELQANDQLVTAGERVEYYPIYYVEPLQGNEKALGYDLMSAPTIRYMQEARRTGRFASSGKFRLVQESGQPSGWILTLPFYAGGGLNPADFRGFVHGVFRLEDLLAPAWPKGGVASGLDVLVVDDTAQVPNRILFFHSSRLRQQMVDEPGEAEFVRGFHQRFALQVGGRQWLFLVRPTPEWQATQQTLYPFLMAAAVGLVTLFSGAYLVSNSRRAERVEGLVTERTAELKAVQEDLKKDIRQRCLAEEALQDSNAHLRLALEAASLGIWDWDVVSDALGCSESVYAMFDLQLNPVPMTLAQYLTHLHEEDQPRLREALQEAVRQRSRFVVEYRIVRANESLCWIHSQGDVLLTPQGEVQRLSGVVMDVTERKANEENTRRMERKLQEAQKLESLGVLAGGIAHDFNNLLTGVMGNVSLARMDLEATSPLQPLLEQVESSAQRAAELCQQMLAYSGRGHFVVRRQDLSLLVQETIPLLRLSISKKVALKCHLPKPLPPILADATQIRQIIMNLLTNASDAMGNKAGLITLNTGVMEADRHYLSGTHMSPEVPEGCYVFMEVIDTGCGMSPETLARIFDPFFTTKFTGRGLGLAAVLGIVRGHRGALKVSSEPGQGTTFRLLLPCAPVAEAETPAPAAPPTQWIGGRGLALVVDDEEAVREVLARMLQVLGFTTVTAGDGLAALRLFEQRAMEISLVLLDLTMPQLDGEETLREFKRIRPEVQVLLVSGFSEQEAASRFADGAVPAGILQKPFTAEKLREKLRELKTVKELEN